MTTTPSTPPTPTTQLGATSAPVVDQEPAAGAEQHHGETPSREAARWRTKLREVESERDGISERLTTYQRREVERLAGTSLSKASDIWLDGADLAALLDANGNVDPELVAPIVRGVLDGRPGLAPQVADHGAGRPARLSAVRSAGVTCWQGAKGRASRQTQALSFG